MFEFGFKNKTELPKVKINKNIFPVFEGAKKADDKKDDEEKKVRFKFTGDGEAQRFVGSDPIEKLGRGIEESLVAPRQADPEIQVHPHRESDVLKKMISTSYENIFNIEIPEEKEDVKNEFEQAKGKSGKFNRIRASFVTTMRNKVGFSNEEVEEKMQRYFLKKMKDLDISEELKEVISSEWNVSEVDDEGAYEDEIENIEKSAFEKKVEEIESFFEHLKERINSSTEDDLQSCSFYREKLGTVSKKKLNEEEKQKIIAIISEYQDKINEVWKDKKQKFESEGRVNYRTEMVQRALNGWISEIKRINIGNYTNLRDLEFYVRNVSEPNEDGLKNEYLDRLRLEAARARKEITHVWQEKKHELEVEKIKSEFESAIGKIHKISREEYRLKYGSKDAGEYLLDYDLRNKIRDSLNFYLDHVVHPIDASPVPEDWNEKWTQMKSLVGIINSETQYELVVVNGETYSVQVQDQDISHMTESYDEGFRSEKEVDAEEQFSKMAGNFEGYSGEENPAEDLKAEKEEKREGSNQYSAFEGSKSDSFYGDEIIEEENKEQIIDSEAALDEDRVNGDKENAGAEPETESEHEETVDEEEGVQREEENVENVFKKLPDGIVGVFKRYASILMEKLGNEISDKNAIKEFLISELTKKYGEKKEVMLDNFGFTEKDGKIFIEKIVDEALK